MFLSPLCPVPCSPFQKGKSTYGMGGSERHCRWIKISEVIKVEENLETPHATNDMSETNFNGGFLKERDIFI